MKGTVLWGAYFVKRLLDIVGGILGVFLIVICYVFLFIPYHFGENKGKMIFRQKRIGRNGEFFYIYKFRSMRQNADKLLREDPVLYIKYVENGYKLEPHEDPRITKLGYYIRKLSIDEIPQFINVIKGEMSLVGPRPIVLEELEEYKKLNEESIFLSMKPGITGVWQTSGRSNIGYPNRVFLENSYAKNKSIFFDLKILFLTVVKVFKKEGAY
ncbi:sugar transferase [Enterococcus gallinarum]|uniref:sugar transferase n=1 Tax=Enterococcus gallinarum TaxID=1353 RepID=UPI0024339B93|nr:sugar transferase [Enterococcus gallinarum]